MNRLAIAALIAAGLFAQQPAQQKPKVVFVCEHGAAKSVLAAAEFERIAKEHGLSFEVLARGTNIDPELAPSVVKGLKADGLVPAIPKPLKVDTKDLVGAARVVTFGPDLSSILPKGSKALDWSATPSTGENYKAARDYVRKELEKLIAELAQSQQK